CAPRYRGRRALRPLPRSAPPSAGAEHPGGAAADGRSVAAGPAGVVRARGRTGIDPNRNRNPNRLSSIRITITIRIWRLLSPDLVHHPGSARGRYARAGALAAAEELVYDGLDEGQLNGRGSRKSTARLVSLRVLEYEGVGAERRSGDPPFGAENLDPV